VLCAVDIDNNGATDYLLIGAPFHYQRGEEGKVFIYKLLEEVNQSNQSNRHIEFKYASHILKISVACQPHPLPLSLLFHH